MWIIGRNLYTYVYVYIWFSFACVCARTGYGIYFCNSLLFTLIFFRLVKHWPGLMHKWTRVERPFLRAPYHRVGSMSLPVKIRLTALCLFMMTACESASQ